MMAVGTRLEWQAGMQLVGRFRDTIDLTAHVDEWIVAGSLRRRKPTIADVDLVVRQKEVEGVPVGGMFPERVNALWHALEQALDAGIIQQAKYGNPGAEVTRWGPKLRGLVFEDVKIEITSATLDNWGPMVTIRTGPAEFSERMMVRLRARGLHMRDGFLRCLPEHGDPEQIISVPTEDEFFRACGFAQVIPPIKRTKDLR